MRIFYTIGLLVILTFSACNSENVKVEVTDLPEEKIAENILVILGEGGPSGAMFIKSADTYKKYNGGSVYEVHSGDEFVAAVRDFIEKEGEIDHLEYFGHGNEIGLYVNQAPNVNGGLYANDPDLNVDYLAASIYELPANIFAKNGWIQFNGCNVASGFPETNTLAQSVANYFDVDVVAPQGPTEFSRSKEFVDPIPNSNYLDPNFSGDVFMVPTYTDKAFVVVKPQEKSESGFVDIRKGQAYEEAVTGLVGMGLDLGFKDEKFLPYENVTYVEALKFCNTVFKDGKCSLKVSGVENQMIRNLRALKLLVDAKGVALKGTNPWYNSYIWWAKNAKVLTKDFETKKWYTRGEMAELTWNISKL